ncbi:alpha-galactosidase/alpha-n-acetylgalactosaminidase [Geopyxis carbonaria]|nr:alpha-galactosidase/alpha-n-acetylgalactosaminidase [Geopyxis carbonaria]
MWSLSSIAIAATATATVVVSVAALDDGLLNTPQMGFSTWNSFKLNITESVITTAAERLVSLGLKDVGYTYVNLDDGWIANKTRESTNGRLEANATLFPSGIKALSDQIHALGLKLGVYSDAGIWTCVAHSPGSWGYEEEDAASFAEWGVDYLKYDNCAAAESAQHSVQTRFAAMSSALARVGRPIVYSLCEWGFLFPWHWAGSIGHSYRMSGDIYPNFLVDRSGCRSKTAYGLTTGDGGCSVRTILRKMREVVQYTGRGAWADMDMLEVGNFDYSVTSIEMERTHFTYWAALKSPLIIGANLETIRDESLEVLKNREVVALNQDKLAEAPWYVSRASVDGVKQVWAGRLSKGEWVLLLTNESDEEVDVEVRWEQIVGFPTGRRWKVRDLWSNATETETMKSAAKGYTAKKVKRWETRTLRLS